jgi:hypothetical protein
MADEEDDQQQQQRSVRMPQVRTSTVDDDYVYELKPLPKKSFDTGQSTQQGGMAPQFEMVSSPLKNQY